MEEERVIVTTTESIAGQRIVATIGHVVGLAVRTRGIEGNIMAGLAHLPALGDDAMAEFAASLVAARDAAVARMVARATELGASAVVDLRFDSAPVGHEMSEIVAYGTAVTVAPETSPDSLQLKTTPTGGECHRDYRWK
jgi:uncharacterized protein YbjQ (UPF0145 family)